MVHLLTCSGPRSVVRRLGVLGVLGMALALMLGACGSQDDTGAATGVAAFAGGVDEIINDDAANNDDAAEAIATSDVAAPAEADDSVADAPAPTDDAAEADAAATVDDETEAEVPVDHMFSETILPILEDTCAQCHAAGGPGSTHLELATALDAAQAAPSIGWVTEDLWMPPWPASDLSVPFKGDFSLTDDQRAAIQEWVGKGAPLDVDPDTPILSSRPVQRILDPDLVVTSAKGPYQGSTDVLDDYRCLIFDPELTETTWLLATHFEPDQVEVVHHAIVTAASEERRAIAERLDDAEPGPGWTCYGGSGVDGDGPGYSFRMGGWAPGGQPNVQPDGYGIPLQPGDFIIVQIHYHYDESAPADLSRMVFDVASEEELAAAGGAFKTLRGALYLGPAEIPCYEGDTDPLCDRRNALDRLEELYGRRQRYLPDYFLAQCKSRAEDYADMVDGTAWSTCDLPVSNPGTIHSVGAHMHELGLSFRMTLNPDTPDERVLLDIPDWDFDWQYGYQPVEEINITHDDTIRVECAWNRERAPYDAVGYVLWSDGTGDEMCYSSITVRPY